MTRAILVGLLIWVAGGAQTQSSMNTGACKGFGTADAELNRAYKQVLQARAKDASFIAALKEAQRAWVAFRDAQVKALYPDPDPKAYGSVYSMCRCSALEKLTAARAKEIRSLWVEGPVEGDVCGVRGEK